MLQHTRGGIFPGAESQFAEAQTAIDGGQPTPAPASAVGVPPAPSYDPPEGPHLYIVTAHKPSAVLASVKASFTAPDDVNLIFTKVTRIEVHTLTMQGLRGVCDVPIFGRIAALEVIHTDRASCDQLFVLTEERDFFALSWDAAANDFRTEWAGDARQEPGVPSEVLRAAVSPDSSAIALHTYEGTLQGIRVRGPDRSTFIVRLEAQVLDDLQFLHAPSGARERGSGRSTSTSAPATSLDQHILATLQRDRNTGASSLHVFTLDMDSQDLKPLWEVTSLNAGAAYIVPAQPPIGGCVVITEGSAAWFGEGGASSTVTQMERTPSTCWGRIAVRGESGWSSDTRVIVCNNAGSVSLIEVVAVDTGRREAVEVTVTPVGRATTASTVTYLDNGFVFLGSKCANSQLVCINPDDKGEPQLEERESYINIGPIVDATLADLAHVGQAQLVACCNTGLHGSIRLISNGIGIAEQASIELQGIRGIWSLKGAPGDKHERLLIITFVDSTHVLALSAEDELDEAAVPGFAMECMTLFCGPLGDGAHAVQVTAHEVRMIDTAASEGGAVATWRVPGDALLAKVACTEGGEVLVATGQGAIFLLTARDGALAPSAQVELGEEVACVDVACWKEDDGTRLAVVGTWTAKLLLLRLPGMQTVHTEVLGAGMLPRSALFAALGERRALLLGMGDGQLLHWQITDGCRVTGRKSITLGLKPVSLAPFTVGGRPHVFAATDRPAVVYEHAGKLLYSPVNESNVAHVCPFSSPAFPGALAMAKDEGLMIAQMDAIQKLHIRAIALGEHPRRVAYQPSTATFAVVTIIPHVDASALKILSQETWEEVATLQLEPDELGCSVCTLQDPENPGGELYAVGTAFVVRDEPEPQKGRIIVVRYTGEPAELAVVATQTVKGAVYTLHPLCLPEMSREDVRLVATVNHVVCVFVLPAVGSAKATLQLECSRVARVIALYSAVIGRTILVGDIMHSVSLLHYQPESSSLELVAGHHDGQWVSAVAAMDERTHLATDNNFNLAAFRYNADADDDAARGSLDLVARFHLGDFVNRIVSGSLVMQLPDAELSSCPSYLLVTVLGMISLAVVLPSARYAQLAAVQAVLAARVEGVGGLRHASWRAFRREGALPPQAALNVVDGDLLEQLLDMPRSSVETILAEVSPNDRMGVDDLLKVLEDLQRLH